MPDERTLAAMAKRRRKLDAFLANLRNQIHPGTPWPKRRLMKGERRAGIHTHYLETPPPVDDEFLP